MTKEEKELLGISKYAPIKAVVKLNQEGEVIERYLSLKEAAEKNGMNPHSLCNALRQRDGRIRGMWFAYAQQKSSFRMPRKKTHSEFQKNHLPYGGVYKEKERGRNE